MNTNEIFEKLNTLRTEIEEQSGEMADTDTVCRICGASRNFDGAMFTTVGGNICDDCA